MATEEEKQPIEVKVLTGNEMQEGAETVTGTLVEGSSQQPQQSSGMDNKINSLVQKSQIYLELLSNPQIITTPDNVFKGDIEKIVTAENMEDPLAKTLYVELKKCLVELGDMYNMQENVLINVLSDYLNNAKTVIDTLGDNKFNEEKQALDGATCNPGDSDAVCKEKIDKAMERIKALKDEMKKIIDDKKGSLAQFDTRKTEIEGLKTYFSGLSFPEDPTKVEELITQAEAKKGELSGDGEKELLTTLIEHLNELKNKLGEQKSSVDEQKTLEEEEAKLQQELEGLAAEQTRAETDEEAARKAITEEKKEAAADTLDDVEDQIEDILEEAEEGGETDSSKTPEGENVESEKVEGEKGDDEEITPAELNKLDQTLGELEKVQEEGEIRRGEGKKVEVEQTEKQEEKEDMVDDLNEDFADLLEGTGIEVVGDDEDNEGGKTETNNPPPPVSTDAPPIPTGEGVKIAEGARKEVEGKVAQRVADIEGKIEDGTGTGVVSPQTGGRRKQSKKRRRKGKRKSKKNRR